MPTALDLSPEEWKPYIEAASQRPDPPALTPEENQEREQLLSRIQKAANELKKQFTVRRVVLFGSLAHQAWFSLDSDVDLAVEGLESAFYWKAWGLAEDIIDTHPVNFIDIENAGESLLRAIERDGIEL